MAKAGGLFELDDNDDNNIAESKDKNNEIEIEIVDDTPEDDKGRAVAAVEGDDDNHDDDQQELKEENESDEDDKGEEEQSDHEKEVRRSAKTAKERIAEVVKQSHMERRAKEAVTRQLNEAVNFAKGQAAEIERYKQIAHEGEKLLIAEAKRRANAEMQVAKSLLAQANDEGDSRKLADAQELLSRLGGELSRLDAYQLTPIPAATALPQTVQSIPVPSDATVEWQKKNPWFMQDPLMTDHAMNVHVAMVKQGFAVDTPQYFQTIDREMRRAFPDRFKSDDSSPRRRNGTVVAPAARSNDGQQKNPRRVTLTKSQVSLARRLGLTPQQYAAQLIKDQAEDD